jgi:4-coumarate--CoA ligase
MVITILQSGLSKNYSLKSLQNAWTGSAPLNTILQGQFKAYMRDDAPFNQAWGMSETSCVGMFFYYPEQDATGAVGRPLPNCDVKLIDDEGKDITGYHVRGELCMRGPIMINGYFGNDEANRRGFDEEGYFHTGDIGYCDKDTKLCYFVDRKKV